MHIKDMEIVIGSSAKRRAKGAIRKTSLSWPSPNHFQFSFGIVNYYPVYVKPAKAASSMVV